MAPPAFRALVFDPSHAPDVHDLAALRSSGRVWAEHDTLAAQLRDLVRARHPRKRPLDDDEVRPHVTALLDGADPGAWGRWVYYPWSGELVHVLPPREFQELRTDRNRYKLTPEEQDALKGNRVGIAGLSVGNAVALTIALEGGAGLLRLADFDTLELSNTNRIRAGLHQLGLGKAVLAARQIAEFDPFLAVEVMTDGITRGNVDAFLDGLTVVIDECDGIAVKFLLRERARARRLPVVMETSDRGLLDVERFDLEPDRPSFHGLVGDVAAHELVNIDNEKKATLMMKIIGDTTTSARACASLMEIDRTASAWPQLASDVTLGGATLATVVRRLALGAPVPSGRRWVDLEMVIAGEGPPVVLPGAARPPNLPARGGAAPSPIDGVPAEVQFVVEHAALAPSGANCQPWHFWWDGEALELHHDTERSRNHLDRTHHASWLAFGAALENLSIAATHVGREAIVAAGGGCVARVVLEPGSPAPDPRLEQVRARSTRRARCARLPLDDADRDAVVAAARPLAEVALATDAGALDELGAILGASDRLRILHPELHREMMGEVRWTKADTESTRDGLDLELLELDGFQRAAMGVTARVDVVREARRLGRGRALEEHARDSVRDASAVGLLWHEVGGLPAWLDAGRAVQRVWLTCTSRALGLHPWTALVYLFDQLDVADSVLSAPDQQAVAALRERLYAVFPRARGKAPAFLFRLTHGGPPERRALRLPLDHVLSDRRITPGGAPAAAT